MKIAAGTGAASGETSSGGWSAAHGVARRLGAFIAMAMLTIMSLGVFVPQAALAATKTVTCGNLSLGALDKSSTSDWAIADLDAGSCAIQPSGTTPGYYSGFLLQYYTEGAANAGAVLWILPSAVIGGAGQRFNADNPVKCTGAGCGNWIRGDYALCAPQSGACHFSAAVDIKGTPATISGDVVANQYGISNITIEYEPASLPPPPKKAPIFSGVPADISVDTDAGLATAVVTYTAPTANDDVDGAVTPVLTAGLASGSAFPVGETTVTYTATDKDNNSDTASFKVTVSDHEKPKIAPVADKPVPAEAGKTSASVTFSATVSDNVDGAGHFTPVFKIGNSTITSPHVFPLGVTTVTVDANDDTAGNSPSQVSFKVTVTDDEDPSFTKFPTDKVLDVDYPMTSATSAWEEPEATDNDAGVTVKRTEGPASGSSFPLGVTKVTYEAKDVSGNSVTRSFNVTVTQNAAASLTYVVNGPANRDVMFTSGDPTLAAKVSTGAGTGSSGKLLVGPGTYSFGFAVPADIGISAASCTTGGSIDATSHRGSVTVSSGSAVTCTITMLDSVKDTTALISTFTTLRSQLVLTTEPDLQRRLDRLRGKQSIGEFSGFGLSYAADSLPLSINLGPDSGSFSMSFAGGAADPAGAALADAGLASRRADADPVQPFSLWLEGKYAGFDATGGSGTYGVLQGGADVLLSTNLLAGVGVALDWIGLDAARGTGKADGLGLLIGPYLTATTDSGLYLDARAAWGYSSNRFDPYGLYEDEAGGSRALVTAAVGGSFVLDGAEIRPEARLSWYRETIDAYIDSLGVDIPELVTETGTLTIGPTVRFAGLPFENAKITPFASLDAIWSFLGTDEDEALRGSLSVGLDVAMDDGFSLSVSGTYDGLFIESYKALSGTVKVGKSF